MVIFTCRCSQCGIIALEFSGLRMGQVGFCRKCGHLMVWDGYGWRDLTKEEAQKYEKVTPELFKKCRKAQEDFCHANGWFG